MKHITSHLAFVLFSLSSQIKIERATDEELLWDNFIQSSKDNKIKCKLIRGQTKNGESCQKNRDCLSGFCQNGHRYFESGNDRLEATCQPNQAEGSPCSCKEECFSNRCKYSFSGLGYYCAKEKND